MQIKKEEVKQCLLDVACKEFLDKGFEKTSIRKIVKGAGTTIGNFYNYFDSKETLFNELVEDVYNEFNSLIRNHHEIENRELLLKKQDINLLKEGLSNIVKQLLPRIDDRFIILLDKSIGTKYSTSKKEFIDVLSIHFIEHIEEYSPDYAYPELGKILAVEFVTGLLEILKNTKDELKKEQLIIEKILFITFGIIGILQGERND